MSSFNFEHSLEVFRYAYSATLPVALGDAGVVKLRLVATPNERRPDGTLTHLPPQTVHPCSIKWEPQYAYIYALSGVDVRVSDYVRVWPTAIPETEVSSPEEWIPSPYPPPADHIAAEPEQKEAVSSSVWYKVSGIEVTPDGFRHIRGISVAEPFVEEGYWVGGINAG